MPKRLVPTVPRPQVSLHDLTYPPLSEVMLNATESRIQHANAGKRGWLEPQCWSLFPDTQLTPPPASGWLRAPGEERWGALSGSGGWSLAFKCRCTCRTLWRPQSSNGRVLTDVKARVCWETRGDGDARINDHEPSQQPSEADWALLLICEIICLASWSNNSGCRKTLKRRSWATRASR
jgi:hypothetical protein